MNSLSLGLGLGLGGSGKRLPGIARTASSFPEDTASGTTVATLSVVNHPSGSSGWSFSASGTKFNSTVTAGALKTSGTFDYDAGETSTSVTITATKAGQVDIVQTLRFEITNVFEAASLSALSLDDTSVPEDSAATINITGATATSTIALLSGSLPAGMTLNSGARTISGTPTTPESASFTLRETLADSSNSPRDTALSITVTAVTVPDAFAIGDWSLADAASGGTLAVTIASLPSDGGASISDVEYRVDGGTWTSSGGTTSFNITGLTDDVAVDVELRAVNAIGAGSASDVKTATPTVPAFAISTEFPTLKAAYEGGGRAIITQIGDSTTANAGTLKEEESVAQYIVNYLNDQGLNAIQGTFSNGDKGIASLLSWTPAQWGAFFNPDATYTGSWTLYAAGVATNMFGLGQFYSSSAGDKISWTPGFAFDRVEHFHITFSGAGAYDVKIGANTLWNIDGNAANSITKKTAVSVTRASTALDMVIASGTAWPGHFRVWDSTAGATAQVENLGVCNSTSGYWANSAGGTDPGNTIAALGSHLFIINLGLNDQNTGVSAATFQSNLESVIQKCLDAGGDVLVCMPNTATDGHELDSAHQTAVTTACTNKSIGAPVDLRTGFNTGTMLADGVHPNATGNSWIGYDKIGPRILGL